MEPSPAPRVVVRGEVTRNVPPDHATITVTATGRDRRRDRALAQLGEHQRGVTALLEQFADVVVRQSSDSVSVRPELAGRAGSGGRAGGTDRITGYVASVGTRIRLGDVGRVGEVVVAAAALEGCELWGPAWRLDRDSPVHAEVRTEAIGDALSRARGYAAALGSTITGLVELRDVGTGGPTPIMFAAAGGPVRGTAAPPELDLEPALQEVHGAVEAVFTLAPPDLENL